MSTLPITEIRREAELQCRARGINARTVREYAEAAKAGATFPAVVVFRDSKGVHWLADGFHRVAAVELAGRTEIAVDVREGDRKAALLFAASANSEHGLRRTLADKRAAVLRLLAAYPKWSDRKIGEAAKVDNKTVAAARRRIAMTEGEEFLTPPDGGEPAPAPAPDLTAIYFRTLKEHATREPVEHVRALVLALRQHAETTAEQIVGWVQSEPAPAVRAPRRRIVQPRGEAPAVNGGE